MGALHPGHASLVQRARTENGLVVASVFVNPTQFNDPSDLKHYPRTPEADADLLRAAGCDILFMPEPEEMYPPGQLVPVPQLNWGALDKVMEAAHRPGHFQGVVQVVNRLFELVGACTAYFGEKDFQQLAVIRRLVIDHQLPVKIVGCPIIREADGLAMSSRNRRLEPNERQAAVVLSQALQKAKILWPDHDTETVRQAAMEMIAAEALFQLEYFEIADTETLLPIPPGRKTNAVACVAAFIGKVRLIDNMILG